MRIQDVMVAAACTTTICCLGLAAAEGIGRGASDPRLLLDQQHLRAVHQGMVAFGHQSIDGSLPMPGRINRFTDPVLGRRVGAGPANWKKDSSGHLYSALIAREYLDTAVIISPAEANPVVSEYGTAAQDASIAYDYGAYDPASDIYWMGDTADPAQVSPGTFPTGSPNPIFRTKINRPPTNGRSHASYAHAMLCGQRRYHWNVKAEADRVLLGNRGPKDGNSVGEDFTRSWTVLFHGASDVWVGNVVRGDGRVERLETAEGGTFHPSGAWWTCDSEGRLPDNIFDAEFFECDDAQGNWKQRDAWLAMNEVMTDGGGGDPKPLAIYDYLRD